MRAFQANFSALLAYKPGLTDAICGATGASLDELEHWKSGASEPGISQAAAIARAAGIGLHKLVSGDLSLGKRPGIRLLVLDVDGVMTDGGMYFGQSGERFKRFHVKDGQGIVMAQQRGIRVAFLSSGKDKAIVDDRAAVLGVSLVHVGTEPKAGVLSGWCKELGIAWGEVAYVGDDVNDLECISRVGLSACPADADPSVLAEAHVILRCKGGEGCVREFVNGHLLEG